MTMTMKVIQCTKMSGNEVRKREIESQDKTEDIFYSARQNYFIFSQQCAKFTTEGNHLIFFNYVVRLTQNIGS